MTYISLPVNNEMLDSLDPGILNTVVRGSAERAALKMGVQLTGQFWVQKEGYHKMFPDSDPVEIWQRNISVFHFEYEEPS